ncbi:kinetochore protein SPC25 homolog isoform X2 [Prosopis cineraria]|uniref:kinetochore protein SPC25 homolog isoform X2 n=1 Tax=Prosopis cineraria TaxID=364024 RepID=UPI00240F3011|nr:kinetochore protein SPC25 homolog isoform X2 [Prosopis cineraria]
MTSEAYCGIDRMKMEFGRLICDREIPILQHKLDAFSDSHRKSLKSLWARSQETAQCQAKLEEAKVELRDAEDDLVKAQGVKTRKEAKRIALMDAIASAKTRVEDLKSSIQEQKTKNSEYAEILSQHSLGTTNENTEQRKDEIQEVVSWYNTVLGFHVEGGHGVKFTFKNINVNNPKEEFFFTIHHENDTYALLNCEPSLKGTKEFIHELNKANGLFKFVRVMRRKLQEAVTKDLSTSSFRNDTPTEKNENQVQPAKGDRTFKKQTLKRRAMSAALSPGSASSVRQSPRLKVVSVTVLGAVMVDSVNTAVNI